MIQMSFSPTAAGTSNTTLTVTDSTVGSPHAIPVTGIATQTLAPSVTLFSIDSLGQTVSATLNGMATVGGPNIPAVAWIEYGTDPLLATFSKSSQWSFTGDAPSLSGAVTGLSPQPDVLRPSPRSLRGAGGKRIRMSVQTWPTCPRR